MAFRKVQSLVHYCLLLREYLNLCDLGAAKSENNSTILNVTINKVAKVTREAKNMDSLV